LPVKKYAANEM